ncbi:ATP-binding protein [Mucilaginibacter sp. L3T2-6]|uniref:ATP-binding protein n=1 Tax=Mucilaginibacter sp. L3T2-6 TaxID=3062491 RepID=UPI0026760631|nr:ATP-binding protein [Mucilaginibacter sp. L3T2-6]MDO3644009.1 ATP-binding protein [Mucilaginibacter sp. L3T2-6]
MKHLFHQFSFGRLSIRQRMTFLICTLLLVSIIIYGYANYYSIKKASLIVGKERLTAISRQVNNTFSQSAQFLASASNAAAARKEVIQFLKSRGTLYRSETLDILGKLRRDSTWVWIGLLDSNKAPVIRTDHSIIAIKANIGDAISSARGSGDFSKMGKIYVQNGAVYFPIISAVNDDGKTIGYIVSWKSLLAGSKAVDQFSELVGARSTFYMGNTDGSLWTDLIKPLSQVPFTIKKMGEVLEYERPVDGEMMAMANGIPHTNWVLVVAFSEKSVLTGIKSFASWIIVAGVILMAAGFIAASVLSRNITKPLNLLTNAAANISRGNYSSQVMGDLDGSYELRKLASAFNIMVGEIDLMRNTLEKKVKERTAQLENVNKELEAFSYSVSHDLRTPLRAINGYSVMLSEDYEDKLDSDGKRMLKNIINNATMMGQLIDDLLSFSKLGRKELTLSVVDMQSLAEQVTDELLHNEPPGKYKIIIEALPPASADQGMMKQVLLNLISNAIKYSSKKPNPQIEVGFTDEAISTVYFVKDNGAGFNMAYADKLFGVFQRLHSLEDFEGSGVGLALVNRIILKHKGEIWAEGAENQGAVFYFRLPKNLNES